MNLLQRIAASYAERWQQAREAAEMRYRSKRRRPTPKPASILEVGTDAKSYRECGYQVVGVLDEKRNIEAVHWMIRDKPKRRRPWRLFGRRRRRGSDGGGGDEDDEDEYPFTVRIVRPHTMGIFYSLLQKNKMGWRVHTDKSVDIWSKKRR